MIVSTDVTVETYPRYARPSTRRLARKALWRNSSFDSQSHRGCHMAERIMTITRTLRKPKRHLLTYLSDAC